MVTDFYSNIRWPKSTLDFDRFTNPFFQGSNVKAIVGSAAMIGKEARHALTSAAATFASIIQVQYIYNHQWEVGFNSILLLLLFVLLRQGSVGYIYPLNVDDQGPGGRVYVSFCLTD